MIQQVHEAAPQLKLWETETPCGHGHPCNNSWTFGESQWQTMHDYFLAGAQVYSQWNIVLDETGESGWGKYVIEMQHSTTRFRRQGDLTQSRVAFAAV